MCVCVWAHTRTCVPVCLCSICESGCELRSLFFTIALGRCSFERLPRWHIPSKGLVSKGHYERLSGLRWHRDHEESSSSPLEHMNEVFLSPSRLNLPGRQTYSISPVSPSWSVWAQVGGDDLAQLEGTLPHMCNKGRVSLFSKPTVSADSPYKRMFLKNWGLVLMCS